MEILDNLEEGSIALPGFSWGVFFKLVVIVSVLMSFFMYILIVIGGVIINTLPVMVLGTLGALLGTYYLLFYRYFKSTFLRHKKYSWMAGGAILTTPVLIGGLLFLISFSPDRYIGYIEVMIAILIGIILVFGVGSLLGRIMYSVFMKKTRI